MDIINGIQPVRHLVTAVPEGTPNCSSAVEKLPHFRPWHDIHLSTDIAYCPTFSLLYSRVCVFIWLCSGYSFWIIYWLLNLSGIYYTVIKWCIVLSMTFVFLSRVSMQCGVTSVIPDRLLLFDWTAAFELSNTNSTASAVFALMTKLRSLRLLANHWALDAASPLLLSEYSSTERIIVSMLSKTVCKAGPRHKILVDTAVSIFTRLLMAFSIMSSRCYFFHRCN